MMPAFIMTGSTIMPAIWPSCSAKMRSATSRSLKGTMRVRSVIAFGMPVLARHHAVPAVEIDVLVAVDVVDLRSLPMADPDRLRPRDLPAGRHAAGERSDRARPEGSRLRLALDEGALLLLDQVLQPRG